MQQATEVFVSPDGVKVVGRYFEPQSELAGAVFIAPAMGVGQDYYAPLATWLANNGFLVVTFDYRGTGLSRSGSLRGFDADIFDWAIDADTVLKALSNRVGPHPVYWIGHSLGGQIIPFVQSIDRVSKIITVATGSGYWLENAWPLRRRVWLLWFVVVPLVVPVVGYFPGKYLRKVGDIPKNVMTQWRRWCLNQEYCVGVEGSKARAQFAAIQTPITSLSFEDDEMMSRKNIESLHGCFTNAPLTMKCIALKEGQATRIGHFGFFKRKFENTLWRRHLLVELK